MDTSTPVRNDFLQACVNDGDLPSVQENVSDVFSQDLSECSSSVSHILSTQNEEEESLGPIFNKSAELFSCSPIRPKNIPYALLPLLDTPNHKWSDSILTPYKLDSQNEPSPKILTQFLPENSANQSSAHTTATFQKFDDIDSVSESTLNQFSNSFDTHVHSPIIQANQKSNRRGNNKCTKKLFSANEENSAAVIEDEISYQNVSDTTLSAMEHICQSSEILYNNSSRSKLRDGIMNHDLDDCGVNTSKNLPDKFNDYLTTFFDDNLRYKKRFVYPYDAIKRPISPILIDQVIESVLPLEECDLVNMRKSQVIPRSMVSFNELNNSEERGKLLDNASSSTALPSRIDPSTLATLIRRHRNVYCSLKTFFSICRINVVRFKDDFNSCLPVSSQLTLLCEKQELISRLHEELGAVKTGIRIRMLEEFVNFFRCHIHLIYNDLGLRKNNLNISFTRFHRRKSRAHRKSSIVTRFTKNTTSIGDAEQPKKEVFTSPPESIAMAQALLADMQDSDFEIDIALEQSQKILNNFQNSNGEISGRTKSIEWASRSELISSRSSPLQKYEGNNGSNYPSKIGLLFSDDGVIDSERRLSKHMNSIMTGFSTGRGKSIGVRSDHIARGQELLESVSKTLAAENSNRIFPEKMLIPPPQVAVADGSKFIEFESANRCMDVKIDEQLFSRDVLDSRSMDSTQSTVSARLMESHVSKRALQVTSPEIKQSRFKRMKSHVRESEVPVFSKIPLEEFEDVPQIVENLSTCTLSKDRDECLSLKHVSRSASPEICLPAKQRKPSISSFINNETPGSEWESTLNDSLWMAIENSSFLEKDLRLNGTADDIEMSVTGPNGTAIKSQTSEKTVGTGGAAQQELKVSQTVSEIDENFYHGTDDELFSELSESIFLNKTCPSTNNTVNETEINDLQKIDISRITIGFKTASGNKVDVSQADLKKARNIFEGIEKNLLKETFQCPEKNEEEVKNTSKIPTSFIKAAESKLNISKTVQHEDRKCAKDVDDHPIENTSSHPISPKISSNSSAQWRLSELVDADFKEEETLKMPVSFRTAAGRKLSVQNLKRAEKFIKDVQADLMKETIQCPTSPEIGSHPRAINARPKLCPLEFVKNEEEVEMDAVNRSVSFSTASRNVMNVPKIASKKAQKLSNQEASHQQGPVSPEIGVQSTSRVSSRLKSKLAFENDEKWANSVKETRQLATSPEIGLKKKISPLEVHQFNLKIGEEEIEMETSKVAASFSLSITAQEDAQKFCGIVDEVSVRKTPSNTQPKGPELILERNRERVGESSKISISFSTAAGNKLSTPKAYLEKAQKIFEDMDRDLVEESFRCPILPEDDLVSRPASIVEELVSNEKSKDAERSVSCGSTFENRLNVQTLQKADDDRIEEIDPHSASSEFGPSSKTFSSTRPKLRGIALPDLQIGASELPVSFTTAVGNEINVSKTALEKVQKLFQDIDRENDCESFETSFNSSALLKASTVVDHDRVLNQSNDICGPSKIDEGRADEKSGRVSPVFHQKGERQKIRNFSLEQRGKDLPVVATDSSLQNRDVKFVSSNTDELLQISASHRSGSISNMTLPTDLARPVSPVVETRRSYQLKKRQKRRSQITSNSVPLSLIYNGKENESTLGSKSNPEDMLRKIKDTFSQRSNKRKESSLGTVSPVPKRPKESDTSALRTSFEQTDVPNKSKADCTPKCGSYLWNQKNTRRMTLRQTVNGTRPGSYKAQELIQLGLKPAVISVNAQNAGQFVFSSEFLSVENSNRLYGDGCTVLPNENKQIFFENLARGFLASPGVDRRLISEEWIRNHYRWIVWKLSAFEKSYPHLFGNNYLTLDNVLRQLKYRYDREIDRCERSALKRILEFDDSPSRPLILCVASVRPISGTLNEFELELTDGWYSVWSQLDVEMYKLVMKKKIVVGTKLFITNAELIGAREGHDPLEVNGSVRLKIATNSTRLARWDAPLGFFMSSSLPLVRDLRTILPNGGTSYPILSVVARVYPMMYMEKKIGGYSEVYNEKMEFRKAASYEKERQHCWEQLASVITREVEREHNMEEDDDYVEMEMDSNEDILPNQRILDREKLNSLIKERIENRLPERFRQQRIVLRLLKVRIVNDCDDGDKSSSTSAIVTIWNPSEDVVSLLKEGKLFIIHNLSANDTRNHELMLTSNRMTKYEQQSMLPRSTFRQRRYTMISELKRDYAGMFNEIDTVGIVIGLEVKNSNQHIIYLADLKQNILAMKFRFDLKDYGFEEVLKKKTIVAAINLSWKGEMMLSSNIPFTFVTEYTTFTQKSRLQHLQSRLAEFDSHFKFKCLDTFVEECEKKIEYASQSHFPAATSTPVKLISSKSADVECKNVSNQSESLIDVSSNLGKSLKSKDTQSRIDRLRLYGEPPPLSPITMSSVSNVRPKAVRLSIQSASFRSKDCRSNKSV